MVSFSSSEAKGVCKHGVFWLTFPKSTPLTSTYMGNLKPIPQAKLQAK